MNRRMCIEKEEMDGLGGERMMKQKREKNDINESREHKKRKLNGMKNKE